MIYVALIISSIYMFVCSAVFAEDFDLVEDRDGAKEITFSISVLLYMLAATIEHTAFGSYMIGDGSGFDILSLVIIVAASYLILDCIEKTISKLDVYNCRHMRVLNNQPRREIW